MSDELRNAREAFLLAMWALLTGAAHGKDGREALERARQALIRLRPATKTKKDKQ